VAYLLVVPLAQRSYSSRRSGLPDPSRRSPYRGKRLYATTKPPRKLHSTTQSVRGRGIERRYLFSDTLNYRIRMIDAKTGLIHTVPLTARLEIAVTSAMRPATAAHL